MCITTCGCGLNCEPGGSRDVGIVETGFNLNTKKRKKYYDTLQNILKIYIYILEFFFRFIFEVIENLKS